MKIKKFSSLSREQVLELANIHYNHWVKFNPAMKLDEAKEKFLSYSTDNLPFGLVLLDKNQIVGFCVLKKENLKKYPELSPWISNLIILPEFRGMGYGTKLMNAAFKELTKLGYKKIYLWTDQAPRFYEKLGYKFEKEIEKNEGGKGLLFSKIVEK